MSSSSHFALMRRFFSSHINPEAVHLVHLIPFIVLMLYLCPVWTKAWSDMRLSLKQNMFVGHVKILALVMLSSVPLAIVGVWKYHSGWSGSLGGLPALRSVGASAVLFGALLMFADYCGKSFKDWKSINAVDASVIGLIQCLSLISGASRLGLVMTAARFLGYQRSSALYLGFLTAIPVLFGSQILHFSEAYVYYKSLSVEAFIAPLCFSGLGCLLARAVLAGPGLRFVALYRVIVGFVLLLLF